MTAALTVARPAGQRGDAGDLRNRLDPGFLAAAGWDPQTQTLAPPPGHPLLGFRVCLVRGCQSQGLLPEELCATCRGFYRQSDLGMEEFIAAGPVRARRCGEVICGVDGCPRPVRNQRLRLCYTHEYQRCRLQLPLTAFLAHPEARPLPSFGACQVTVCTRQAAAVLVLIWMNLSWPGLVALVACAVVMLVAWWWFWPGSFSRWVAGPARGRWRAGFYRRRWAGVMAISGAAPTHQGQVILPVLGVVTATKYTDRVQVRLVSGQSPADLAGHAEALAHGFGALLCRVRTGRSGRVVLEFVRRDALAAAVPALPIPANPDLKALPVGRREDGLP